MNLEKLFMNLLESFAKLFSERANGQVCTIPTYVTNEVNGQFHAYIVPKT